MTHNYEAVARRAQAAFEPAVAMIFFVPEAFARYKAIGLRGRQGYFCARSAAFGATSGQVVAATFYNFNPDFVIEQVTTGWQTSDPATVLAEIYQAVKEAYVRLLAPQEDEEDLSGNIGEVLPLVKKATANLPLEGRALYAAQAALPWPDDPHMALWHGLNLLREFRGDGHITALMANGVRPVEALLLQAAFSPHLLTLEMLLTTRRWPEDAVRATQQSLAERDLLQDGKLTEKGQELRDRIEHLTDQLDTAPFENLGEADSEKLVSLIQPLGRRIVKHGGLQRQPAPR